MPVEELCDTSGHWVWQRDEGSKWLLDETAGVASLFQQAFAAEPEHWFRKREDGKWVVKVLTSTTDAMGEEEVLDVGGKAQEGVTMLSGEEFAGCTRAYIEGSKLVIEWQGRCSRGAKVHLKNSKEVILGQYHSTVEDLVRNVKGTRIFKKYPWYRIDNATGETITLCTFSNSDVFCLLPAMTVEVKPGASYVDASASDKDEERAILSLADGRELAKTLKAFETVTIQPDEFKQYPYYKVENLTEETVSLTTYAKSDYFQWVPSMTVEVKPGPSYVMASSRSISEEQAAFTLLDGRSYKGFAIKAFDTVVLRPDNFKRYPHYKIENTIGETVTLTTYTTSDFVYLVPAMIVDVEPGTSYIHGSSGDVLEEQAVFSMRDGRRTSGFSIKAFQTVVLEEKLFH